MNRRTAILIGCLIVFTTFTMPNYVKPAKAAGQVTLLDNYGFYLPPPTGPYGVYTVVGEVRNDVGTPVNKINFTVTFYDLLDNPLGSSYSSTTIDCVLPNTVAPFRAALSGPDAPNVDHYRIGSIIWRTDFPSGKPFKLQIINSTYYTKDAITYTTGVVKNTGSTNATNVRAIVIYHNKTSGNIFWVTNSLTTPLTAAPGGNVTLKVSTHPRSVPTDKCNVTVVVESPEFLSAAFFNPIYDTILPEFSNVRQLPNPPTSVQITGVNVTVVKPNYASNITKDGVKLYFRALGSAPTYRNMSRSGPGGSLFSSFIDRYAAGQTVEFWFEATDEAGNKQVYPATQRYRYTVQGEPSSGVPIEYVLIALLIIVLLVVIAKYRKRLF